MYQNLKLIVEKPLYLFLYMLFGYTLLTVHHAKVTEKMLTKDVKALSLTNEKFTRPLFISSDYA